MSNDGDEFLSDEDMFSPKKPNRKQKASLQPVPVVPGCKDRYVAKYKKLLNVYYLAGWQNATGDCAISRAGIRIPPPPDHTNPDYHLDKLLALWNDNQSLLWEGKTGDFSKEKAEDCPLGVCMNTDRSCEEFELMGSQLCERYIWCETAATTSTAYIKLTQSAKKRRKANGWGLSPRTRISYLTRRMTTFQKDNIASAVASNKTTQILVARSEPGKKVSGKGNGLKGKRALFLSPEHDNKFQTPEQGKNKRLIRRLTLNSSPVRAESERLLRNSDGSARSSEKKRCSRSLFSAASEPADSNLQQKQPDQNQQQIGGLSTQHRQKMLWAVSNALKAVKIRMTDPEFKTHASRLFKATTEKWRASTGAASGDRKASTSDAMLVAAKSLVEEITGRKMSPKSAKKTAPKSQKIRTPEKSSSRDENNPPSANAPDSLLSVASLNENGVFPLERVGILAEKLLPTGNISNVSSFATPTKSAGRVPFAEETSDVEFDPDLLTTRKRKRQETERLPAMDTEVMVCQRRSRTPRKTLVGLSSGPSCSYQSADISGVPKIDHNFESRLPASPTFKRQRLESLTPVKSIATGTPVRQSPRLHSYRTPLKSTAVTPTKSSILNGTPSKSSAAVTPLKTLTTIEETPTRSSPDVGTSLKLGDECRTPLKPPSGSETPLKSLNVNHLKFSEFGTPSKSPAVKPARGILTPTSKTCTPLRQSSTCGVPETRDGAGSDNVTPKKCVTFEGDGVLPLALLPGTSRDDKPPLLRPEVLPRRSFRCCSADLPPPKLVRATDLSPPPISAEKESQNGWTDDSSETRRTPLPRRRASAPTPGQPTQLDPPGNCSGRKKVSLSLTSARKSKTPEDCGDGRKPDDVTLTPRRSSRRATAAQKSSPH